MTVFTLLKHTEPLAEKIAKSLGDEHKALSGDVLKQLATAFQQGRPIIALMASGIILRAIGPLLANKHSDAPVISLSPDGQHVVPLLGGHHGANQLARQIAEITKGTAAITTASDSRFRIALDEPPAGYVLANPADYKAFMARVLAGEKIKLNARVNWLETSDLPFFVIPANAGIQKPAHEKESVDSSVRWNDEDALQITITATSLPGSKSHLVYHPKTLTIGVGCERHTDPQELIDLISRCLASANLSRSAIACLTSIDLKSDERAITQAARHFNVPARFFTADQLNQQAPRLKNPSEIVMAEVGCPGVAEGAALAAGGKNAELIIEKTKSTRATCAITQSPEPIITLPGTPRGKLSVIGIGPGSDEWRSPQATSELINASDWVGYDLYLDLVADLKTSQNEHRFGLGKEEARVRHAFALAGQGRDVALVCSGDAAIYAMAALVYEVLDSGTLSPCEQRVEIKTLPGISAFQAASARAGALIGHDFCTISLSDLLTPWETIEKRLKTAAEGDFNIAFYNPRSLKRTDQLQKAIDILKPHRTPDTPVIIASNLGR
ncbi:MAG TPA: precorrin-3B C(17)-methyltransferase, partial [Rhizobiales bacterium]|nr:precorrin-3B C(17)-methyltransferase [Hyphomicrobiales bacterium]